VDRVKIFSICLLFLLAGLGGSAALHPGARHSVAPPGAVLLQSPAAPQKSPTAIPKNTGKHPQNRLGDWLQSHKDLSPEQQEKALERDPKFKKLTPERQVELKERLRKFNALPPEKRQRALQRMNYISGLSPEQRQQLRDANQKLEALPRDRKVMIHTALRHLRKMGPQERAQTMQSDQFRSTFSDQEQGILQQLSAINPEQGPPTGQTKQPKQ
jgi:DNA-directed RNA polymerase subunit F